MQPYQPDQPQAQEPAPYQPALYQPQSYQPQPYPPAPYPPYRPSRPTNGLAIASLVCSIAGFATCVSAPVGAVLGHVARRQIRERGEEGDGLALAGIIVGWILTGLLVAYLLFIGVVLVLGLSGVFDTATPG
jgi:hypothetical protein